MRKIYVASSWRNLEQPLYVQALRQLGHEVYDFRNPTPTDDGFQWSEVSADWKQWAADDYLAGLAHPIAEQGYQNDWRAMQWADTGVLLLPSGRSAHIEAGYFVGAGKELYIVLGHTKIEPELMYKMATRVVVDWYDLYKALHAEAAA